MIKKTIKQIIILRIWSGTHFIKDGKLYKLQTKDLCSQAKKANINFSAVE